MKTYYLVTKPGLVILPDSVEKANAKAPIKNTQACITPAMLVILLDAGRILNA